MSALEAILLLHVSEFDEETTNLLHRRPLHIEWKRRAPSRATISPVDGKPLSLSYFKLRATTRLDGRHGETRLIHVYVETKDRGAIFEKPWGIYCHALCVRVPERVLRCRPSSSARSTNNEHYRHEQSDFHSHLSYQFFISLIFVFPFYGCGQLNAAPALKHHIDQSCLFFRHFKVFAKDRTL